MKRKLIVGLVIIGIAFTVLKPDINPCSPGDWCMFHYDPQHTGYNDNDFFFEDPELIWKFETDESIDISPVVAKGRVYVGSGNRFCCLNAYTGQMIWIYETDDDIRSSPAVFFDKVYVSYWNSIHCIDAYTGELIQKYNYSHCSSPSFFYGTLCVGSMDGNIYFINPEEKKEIRRISTIGSIYSSPAIADDYVYVGSDETFYCFNGITGEEIWKYKTGGNIKSSPAVADGKVYFGSDDGTFYCLDVYTREKKWKYETGDNIWSSPSVADGKVYFGSFDNHFYCLNAETGDEIWIENEFSWISSSPAVTGIHTPSIPGEIIYQLLGRAVYFGSFDNHFYCLNAETGEEIWKYKTGDSIRSSPAVADGNIYFGSDDGNIYCFGKKRAVLSIESNPKAVVYINNVFRGVTPLILALKEGKYDIEIKANKYEPYNETIELSLDEPKDIQVELERDLSYYWKYAPYILILIFFLILYIIFRGRK